MSTIFKVRRARQRLSENFRRLKRSDRQEVIRQFEKRLGYQPSLDEPVSYNEKLTRFKIEADRPVFRQLADKLAVREFVADRIGEKYLIPLIASAPRLSKELFDSLPDSFVIKGNHGSAMNHIVYDKNKINFNSLCWETDGWLCRNYFFSSREAQYRRILPRLVIEQLMLDDEGKVPADYRLHCFSPRDGKKRTIVQVDSDGFGDHTRDYFDVDWQRLALQAKYPNSLQEKIPIRPEMLDGLVETAWKLADGFAYVRVDLYVVQGQIYFGEMTFTPVSGFMPFDPPQVDRQWGEWFDLDHQLSLSTLKDVEQARKG